MAFSIQRTVLCLGLCVGFYTVSIPSWVVTYPVMVGACVVSNMLTVSLRYLALAKL
jgi:hypothetical protein